MGWMVSEAPAPRSAATTNNRGLNLRIHCPLRNASMMVTACSGCSSMIQ
jgi:hypothetical protein